MALTPALDDRLDRGNWHNKRDVSEMTSADMLVWDRCGVQGNRPNAAPCVADVLGCRAVHWSKTVGGTKPPPDVPALSPMEGV